MKGRSNSRKKFDDTVGDDARLAASGSGGKREKKQQEKQAESW